MKGYHGAPRCEMCEELVDNAETRYQMTVRLPSATVPLRLWWLCGDCYAEVMQAIDAGMRAKKRAVIAASLVAKAARLGA